MTTSLENKAQELDVKTTLENMNLPQDQVEDILKAISETINKLKAHNLELENFEILDNLSDLKKNITNWNETSRTSISVKMKDKEWKNIGTIDYNVKTRIITKTLVEQNNTESTNTQQPTQTNEIQPNSQTAENKPQSATAQANKVNQNHKSTDSQFTPQTTEVSSQNIDSHIDIHTHNGYLLTLNKLLEDIKVSKKWISKKSLSKSWKETMDLAKTKLKQYEDMIKSRKRWLENQKWIEISDDDIYFVRNIEDQINNANKDIQAWYRWEFSNTASFMYNSPEIAKKSNKLQTESLAFQNKLKEEVKQWAILNIFGKHEQTAIDFYRRIAEWKYTQADYQIFQTNAQILAPSLQKCGITIPNDWNQRMLFWTNWPIDNNPSTIRRTIDYTNMEWWETFQKWWIAWVIDKALSNCKNMTPWQRNTWKSLWVLWWYAAWIYGLYKFFTSKKMWFWWKAWLTAATIFWAQALTWEWPLSLYNKLMTWWFSKEYLEDKFWNAFWDAVNGIWNSWIEVSNTLAPAMYSMMIFNPSTTVWEVRNMTSNFKNENAWKDFRGQAIIKLRNKYWENSTEHFSATFSDKFDEQKWSNRLASFWVTDSTADSANIYELANNASMNEIIIEKFKEENWLKVNPSKKKEFDNYMKDLRKNNQAVDIDVLENSNNGRFILDKEATYTERPEDEKNRKALEDQVESLSISDPQKKSDLKTAIVKFYNERSIDTKPNLSDFNLKTENGFVILKSHSWQETKIDINKWELVWFWNWIRFSDLSELLNVADLSNRILETQKWKQPKDMPPFQYKIGKGWRWIYFNDAEIWSLNFDTRVLSWGLWWSIEKIDTLSNPNNAEEFAKYLSKRRENSNKVNLDSTNYPILHDFSEKTKIIFTNEQEAKDLELRLKEIKNWKKFAIWQQGWNPFSISRQFKTFDNRLVFTAINWTNEVFQEDISEKFPTIMRNKEDFLKFMNDKNNWMRWSALNR